MDQINQRLDGSKSGNYGKRAHITCRRRSVAGVDQGGEMYRVRAPQKCHTATYQSQRALYLNVLALFVYSANTLSQAQLYITVLALFRSALIL